MKWSEESLSSLPVSDGYRLRGEAMTRIEVFSDAAFAFAVTMLVISLGSVPQNYEQLVDSIKAIPSFASSFAVIMVLWVSHRRWNRRFGLDDRLSTFLTLALIFVILVYVYPLRIMMSLLYFSMSGGWFPSDFAVSSKSEVAGLMLFYGAGFLLVSLIQLGLYLNASSQAKELCLNSLERVLVKQELIIWSVQVSAALVSVLIAGIFIHSWGYLAGFVYCLTPIAIPLSILKTRRARRAILAGGADAE